MNNINIHRGLILLLLLLTIRGCYLEYSQKQETNRLRGLVGLQGDSLQAVLANNSSQLQTLYEGWTKGDALFIEGYLDSALAAYQNLPSPWRDSLVKLRQTQMDSINPEPRVLVRYLDRETQTIEDSLGLLIEHLQTNWLMQKRQHEQQIQALEESRQQMQTQLESKSVENEQLAKAFGALKFKSSKGSDVRYWGKLDSMGKAEGQGVGLWSTGSFYEGEWKNNFRHGKGLFVWADGERYEGDYVNDKRQGKGKYQWKNGEYYIGDWVEDRREGKGILYDKKGKVKLEGEWKNDELLPKKQR